MNQSKFSRVNADGASCNNYVYAKDNKQGCTVRVPLKEVDIICSPLQAAARYSQIMNGEVTKYSGKNWISISEINNRLNRPSSNTKNGQRRFRSLAKSLGFDFNNNKQPSVRSSEVIRNVALKNVEKKQKLDRNHARAFKECTNFEPPQANLEMLKMALGEHGNYIALLVEDMYFLYRSLLNAKSNFDRVFAIEHVLRARTGKPFIVMAYDAYTAASKSTWLSQLQAKMEEMFPMIKQREEIQSAEEIIGLLRGGVDQFEMVRKSAIFKKLHKFGSYCISLSLFDHLGIEFSPERQETLDKYFKKKDLTYGTDFYHCILDTIVSILERGAAVVTTGSFSAIFHSGDNYTRWIDRSTKLLRQSKFLGNPEPHGIKPEIFFNELSEVIAQGAAITNYAKALHGGELKYVRGLLAELELVKANEITVAAALKMRKAPFGVLINGASAQMKTAFYRTLIHFYASKFKKPLGDEYVYTRNFFDDFFSAFRSTMWCIIYDDAAYMNPNAAQGIDPSIAEIIQILNNVPVITNQARLEDKGTVPCQPDLVVITTNTKSLNAKAYFAHPHAVQRRTPYVFTIEVKPEYMSEDGQSINAAAIPVNSGYMDVWNILVERIIKPVEYNDTCKYEKVDYFTNIYDFFKWFNGACDDHHFRQSRADQYNTSLNTFELCMKCIRHPCVCPPPPEVPQSNDTVLAAPQMNEETLSLILYFGVMFLVGPVNMGFLLMWKAFDCVLSFIFWTALKSFYHCYMRFRFVRWASSRVFWSRPVQRQLYILGAAQADSWRRRAFAHAGDRITNASPVTKKIAALLAAVAVVYAAYRITRRVATVLADPQMDIKEIGETPKANDKVENPWKRENMTLAPCDLSNQALSWKSLSDDVLCDQLMRNAVALEIVYADGNNFKKRTTRAFCIGGRLYVANKHGIPETPFFDMTVIQSPVEEGITANFKERKSQEEMFFIEGTDLVFFELTCPAKKDRSHLFVTPKLQSSHSALYIGRDYDGSKVMRRVQSAHRTVRAAPPIAALPYPLEGWAGVLDGAPTVRGDCGTILVLRTAYGPQIAGLHYSVAVSETVKDIVCFAVEVNTEHVNLAKTYFGDKPQAGVIRLKEGQYGKNLIGLAEKSTFNYIREGTANVMGSLDGHRPHHRSSVQRTPICEEALRHGYQLTTGPPVLKGWEIWRNAAMDMISADDYMNPKILAACAQTFLTHVCENVDLKEVHIYDVKTSMQGADGVQYVDSINWGTSMGFPWNKSKKNFVIDPTAEKKGYTPEIIEAAQNLLNSYERGERAYPIFTGTPKDEPRKFKKIKNKQTRIFAAAPAHFCLLMRMFYLPLVRLMQNNRFIFCSAPGIDVSSLQWEKLYRWMTEHGMDTHIAGDYAAFDKNMKAKVILLAFEFLVKLAERAGYPDWALRIMRAMSEDIAFPLMNFNGDLVEFFGTNPSGHPLTVIINCIVGVFYMMYCFAQLAPEGYKLTQFFDLVRLITYGDDNHLNVSKTIPWFNHTSIAEVLADVGIGYTMADKEAKSIPYIHIDDVTFLKRSFRYDSDVGAVLAPLDEGSIGKMLTMHVVSKSVSSEEQIIQTIGAASAEYFFYGKEIFLQKQKMLKEIVDKCQLSIFVRSHTFQSWEQLYNRFWENSCARGLITQVELEAKRVTCTVVTVPEDFVSLYSEEEWTVQGSDEAIPQRMLAMSPPTEELYSDEWVLSAVENKSPFKCFLNRISLFSTCCDMHEHDVCAPSLHSYDWSEPQSGEVDCASATAQQQQTTQEVVQFLDLVPGPVRGGYAQNSKLVHMDEASSNASLGDFLSRPVLIGTFTWAESDSIGTSHTFAPWDLLFHGDSVINNKLANYAFLQCDLKIKVMINASPFYYGAMLMSYQPLTSLTPSTIVNDAGTRYFIPYSQRPHMWILPQSNQGGELELPFFYHQNWINTQVRSEFQNFGTLSFQNFTTLASANGATGVGITVQIYAWAENVRLAGPSIGLVTQSGEEEWHEEVQSKEDEVRGADYTSSGKRDEYSRNNFDGPISSVASAVSSFASLFTSIPFIGEFATATQLGAQAVAIGASAFGYSNPPVLANAQPFRSVPFPQLAATEISYPVEKLTIDPKNELTLDPTTVGLHGQDELSLRYLCQRESYLTTASWANSNAANDILFYSAVAPLLYDNDNGTDAKVYMTPMCWVAQLFNYWRGDIIFRFRFIASQYHKGRVRISYDPAGNSTNLTTTATTSSAVFTKIVDLGKDTDVEMRIPYMQAIAWLNTGVVSGSNLSAANILWSTSASPSVSHNIGFTNGSISIRVLTALTAPVATTTVKVLVSVRGAENLEFGDPQNINADNNIWCWSAPQSHDMMMGEEETEPVKVVAGTLNPVHKERYLVNFGEHILSLRQLLRRHSLTRAVQLAVPSNDIAVWKQNMYRVPLSPGYYTNGLDSAKHIDGTAATLGYNYVFMTPLQWLMPAFIGQRGSINWVFNLDNTSATGQFRIYRISGSSTTASAVAETSAAAASDSASARFLTNNSYSGAAGQSITNQNTQSGIAVELPNYNNYRFQNTAPSNSNSPSTSDGSSYDCHRLEISISTKNVTNAGVCRIWQYASIGTDFNLHFFLNVPTLYIYRSVPASN